MRRHLFAAWILTSLSGGLLLVSTWSGAQPASESAGELPTWPAEWTIAKARLALFSEIKHLIDPRNFAAQDPDYEANRAALDEGKTRVGERVLENSGEGFYSVTIGTGPTLFYSSRGKLKAVEIKKQEGSVVKSYNYLVGDYAERLGLSSGQLLFANLRVSDDEQFVFETTGNLHAHWVKNECFKADGSRCKAKRTSNTRAD
jgi:hypothetical protein